MILGIGMDLVEVARIANLHERFGERFLRRILCPGEMAYCLSIAQPAPHLAARFAAKEAARLIAVVVFPTPPFWLVMAMTLATGLNPITKCSTWNIRN